MRPSFLLIAATAVVAAAAVAWFGASSAPADRASTRAASGIAELEARVERVPDDSQAWKRLAATYRQRGRLAEAINAYVRASRLSPRDPEIIRALKDLSAGISKG